MKGKSAFNCPTSRVKLDQDLFAKVKSKLKKANKQVDQSEERKNRLTFTAKKRSVTSASSFGLWEIER